MAKLYIVVNVESFEDYNCGIFDTKQEADDICYLCNSLCNTNAYIVHLYDSISNELEHIHLN